MNGHTNGGERFWAGVSYVLLFAPILAPLVIYFVGRPSSRFVAFHALQSLFIELTLVAAPALLGFLGWILGPLLGCFALGFWAAGIVLAIWGFCCRFMGFFAGLGGDWKELPLVGPWARSLV